MAGDGRRIVLVVEDDLALRQLVSECLLFEGYTVLEARDGPEAISILHQHRPPLDDLCLVLLDLMLPERSGLEVLDHWTRLGRYVPVVAMSANDGLLAAASAAGARGAFRKPFDLDQLLAVVARNCGLGG